MNRYFRCIGGSHDGKFFHLHDDGRPWWRFSKHWATRAIDHSLDPPRAVIETEVYERIALAHGEVALQFRPTTRLNASGSVP